MPRPPLPAVTLLPIAGGQPTEPPAPLCDQFQERQIEEFLRQTGKAKGTQKIYRWQLRRFSTWCQKSWLDVTASDLGQYRWHLQERGLKPASINHALNALRSFYQWMRASRGYPSQQPLPTEGIGLEALEEPQSAHLEAVELADVWQVLEGESPTRLRDRAIVAVLSHGLRASEVAALNVEHWDGKILTVHRSKGNNVSEVPLSRQARQELEGYLDWRRQQGEVFDPLPESPMFLRQDPGHGGERLGYSGLYKLVKKLGERAEVEAMRPHRFRHTFGSEVTRRGVDPVFGKELMGIKSDRVFQRYTRGVLKQAAAEAYLQAMGEIEDYKDVLQLL